MFQAVTTVLLLLIVTAVPGAAVGAFCSAKIAELVVLLLCPTYIVWPAPTPKVSLFEFELLPTAKTQELLRVVVRFTLAVLLLALLAVAVAPKALKPVVFVRSIPAMPKVQNDPEVVLLKVAVATVALIGVGATAYQISQSPP
jgi:hypothetical protein